MKDYDGWLVKNRQGKLIHWTFGETKSDVIRSLENRYDDHWKTLEEKYGFRIVKVKLMEVK